MKAVINEKEMVGELKYPCLKISNLSDNIVLFTDLQNGTVVFLGNRNNGSYYLGERSSFDYDVFTPFTGSITLSND